jgi:hypothetical protein
MRLRINVLGLVYLIVGILVAAAHHYFRNLHSIRLIASAALAVVLWPLVLLHGLDDWLRVLSPGAAALAALPDPPSATMVG